MQTRTVTQWLELIRGDFAGTPVDHIDVRLVDFDPARLQDYADVLPDPGSWINFSDPTAHRLFLAYGGAITSLDNLNRLEAAVHIASCLQDYVIDESEQPWPTVNIDGRDVVLDPALDAGSPVWQHIGSGYHRPLGQLNGGDRS